MTNRIVMDPEILSGKPIIKGTRISVEFVLELLSSGMSIDAVLVEYPHLTRDDVLAALEYATRVLRHEEVYPALQAA
ncbi:DUF433 domain-containing protein [Candidatus Woesearchaeota archaeon]|nr:DUF433 domain-containing protein [Candidatus Woesearchaeota archaeon]